MGAGTRYFYSISSLNINPILVLCLLLRLIIHTLPYRTAADEEDIRARCHPVPPLPSGRFRHPRPRPGPRRAARGGGGTAERSRRHPDAPPRAAAAPRSRLPPAAGRAPPARRAPKPPPVLGFGQARGKPQPAALTWGAWRHVPPPNLPGPLRPAAGLSLPAPGTPPRQLSTRRGRREPPGFWDLPSPHPRALGAHVASPSARVVCHRHGITPPPRARRGPQPGPTVPTAAAPATSRAAIGCSPFALPVAGRRTPELPRDAREGGAQEPAPCRGFAAAGAEARVTRAARGEPAPKRGSPTRGTASCWCHGVGGGCHRSGEHAGRPPDLAGGAGRRGPSLVNVIAGESDQRAVLSHLSRKIQVRANS